MAPSGETTATASSARSRECQSSSSSSTLMSEAPVSATWQAEIKAATAPASSRPGFLAAKPSGKPFIATNIAQEEGPEERSQYRVISYLFCCQWIPAQPKE